MNTHQHHACSRMRRSALPGLIFGGALLSGALLGGTISVTPVYQIMEDDYTATDQGNGIHTVPTAAEDYTHEIWERPFDDDMWSDANGVRTITGEYFGYGDIESGQMGWNDDYLFASVTVVGGFTQDGTDVDNGVGLKGHYYVYFSDDADGAGGYALDLSDGTAADGTFTNGKAKLYRDTDASVGGPGGLTTTGEFVSSSDNGYEDELNPDWLYVRAINSDTVEFAVDLALAPIDASYLDSLQFIRLGVAISNPSGKNELLANDAYVEAIGSGVEYDTLGLAIPEPDMLLLCSAALVLLTRRRLT